MAKPLLGWAKLDSDFMRVEFVGSGTELFEVYHDRAMYQRSTADRWQALFPRIYPVLSWCAPSSVARPRSVTRLGRDCLLLEFESRTERLWFDRRGGLTRAQVVIRLDGQASVLTYTFSRCEILTTIDEQKAVRDIPRGYRRNRPERTYNSALLPVGTRAPSAPIRSLAGKEFSLSDFRGKTVVLVFWHFT